MVVLVTIEAFAILLLGLLVAGLLRSHAEILRTLHNMGAGLDLDRGSEPVAPPTVLRDASATTGFDVSGVTPRGEAITVGVTGAEGGVLLAFLSSGCLTCTAFWDALADGPQPSVPGDARLVIVTKGPDQESQSKLRQLAPLDVPVVMSTQAWEDYEVPVAPYFLYVHGPSGQVVGEGAGNSWAQVSALIAEALADAGLAGGDRASNRERRRLRARASDAAREARADADLLAAGIHSGHPSLYPATQGDAKAQSAADGAERKD